MLINFNKGVKMEGVNGSNLNWMYEICDKVNKMFEKEERAQTPINRNDPHIRQMIASFKAKEARAEQKRLWNMATQFWEDVENGKIEL